VRGRVGKHGAACANYAIGIHGPGLVTGGTRTHCERLLRPPRHLQERTNRIAVHPAPMMLVVGGHLTARPQA
jgi:hypothetical protein